MKIDIYIILPVLLLIVIQTNAQSLDLKTNEVLTKISYMANSKRSANNNYTEGSQFFDEKFYQSVMYFSEKPLDGKLWLRYNAYLDEIEIGQNQEFSDNIVLKNNKIKCEIGDETYHFARYESNNGSTELGYLIKIHKGSVYSFYKRKRKIYRKQTHPRTSLERAFPARFINKIDFFYEKGGVIKYLGENLKEFKKNLPTIFKSYNRKEFKKLGSEQILIELIKKQ